MTMSEFRVSHSYVLAEVELLFYVSLVLKKWSWGKNQQPEIASAT